MYKGNSSRVLPIIIVLIVIAIAVAALVSVGRAIFGGGAPTDPSQIDTSRETLLNTASDNNVRMTVRGPIVADEDFRSYRVTVNATSRSLVTYSGYLDETLASDRLNNNGKAYEQFVHALDKANLIKGTPFNDERDDTRGICATGRVYEFEVRNSDGTVKRLWTSTCRGSKGTFVGSVEQVSSLFLQQIPNNDKLLDKIDL